ncbi:MAG: hypothetical protein Q8P45_03605 [Candidatus Harrisonbacteria bacterium]|nr:hypothetical protein [Candidatus Harrisonbacteria bacterium]
MKSPFQKLEEIRGSDEKTKLRWVIILSTLSILIVLMIWIAHVNSIFQIQIGSKPKLNAEHSRGSELLQTLRLRTANTILYFREKFAQKNEIIIEREEE